jgi:hypothetical protein
LIGALFFTYQSPDRSLGIPFKTIAFFLPHLLNHLLKDYSSLTQASFLKLHTIQINFVCNTRGGSDNV